MAFNVAVDGPAGAGKSTVAKGCGGKKKFHLCGYRRDVPGDGALFFKTGNGSEG